MSRSPPGGGGGDDAWSGDGGMEQVQRRHRRRRRARTTTAALSLFALLVVVATADASNPSSRQGRQGGGIAAALGKILASGGKRLLQTLAPAAAEPAQATFSVADEDANANAAAATTPSATSIEYLFDPVEHEVVPAETAEAAAEAEAAAATAAAEAAAAGGVVMPGTLADNANAASASLAAALAAANATADARRGWRSRPWHSRMRELFPDVLADGHEALDLSPARHGWSIKTGVADLAAWALREDGRRLDDFFAWRTDRCAASRDLSSEQNLARSGSAFTCDQARHPPTPFPGCHVFVNHEYRFIYIRSPKSASTSIVDVLGECGNARTKGNLSPSCMKHSWEGALSVGEIEKVWKDYFVFGFVRNPWKRAYSLYKYLHSDGCMQDGLRRPECRVSWDEFCEDPWGAADVLHKRDCLSRSKSYTYFHMVDQWHCMRTAEGGSAVDFVGSVETGDEDWSAIVKEINRRRDASAVPALPEDSRLGVSNVRKGSVAGPYNGEHSHCLDAVSRWYSCDAEKFGYLPRVATESATAAAGA